MMHEFESKRSEVGAGKRNMPPLRTPVPIAAESSASADMLPKMTHPNLSATSDNPSLHVDYKEIDAEDPALSLGWLSSFALFGLSPRSVSDPRYRALAKFRRITTDHGIEDVSMSDFLRALGVYGRMLDRSAKETLKQRRARKKANKAQSLCRANINPPSFTPTHKRPRTQCVSSLDTFSDPPPEPQRWFLDIDDDTSEDLDRDWNRRCSLAENISPGLDVPPPMPPERFRGSLSSRMTSPRAMPSTKGCIPPMPTPLPTPIGASVRAEHVQLLYHMLRHAESIYGFPISVPSAPRVALTRVTDRGIITSRTGMSNADLKLSSGGAAFLPAHYVAVDRQVRAIIICVRGTANLVDSLTDVAATQDPLKICRHAERPDLDVVEGYGHSGVLRSARNLFYRIRTDTLAALQANPGFELFITGHSLGAATASVLALIMRDDPEFPRALAFCFAPLPCMTYELAERTSEFTITVVNGPDIVPRLSVSVLLPYFATARYVADLSRNRKALLTLGFGRTAINWEELYQHNEAHVHTHKKNHDGRHLFIPGKVFQLVRKNEVHRREIAVNRLFRQQEVEVVAVHRTQFLEVRSRERRMFLSHAPFSYKSNLILALKGMGANKLRKMSARNLFLNMLSVPVAKFAPATRADHTGDKSLANLLDRLGGEDGSPIPS